MHINGFARRSTPGWHHFIRNTPPSFFPLAWHGSTRLFRESNSPIPVSWGVEARLLGSVCHLSELTDGLVWSWCCPCECCRGAFQSVHVPNNPLVHEPESLSCYCTHCAEKITATDVFICFRPAGCTSHSRLLGIDNLCPIVLWPSLR